MLLVLNCWRFSDFLLELSSDIKSVSDYPALSIQLQIEYFSSMRINSLLFITLFYLTFNAQADNTLQETIHDDYGYLEALYIHLHKNPELSFHEADTSARMATELRNLGFTVTENVGGYGVVGVLNNGAGPTVLLRTDMDALPILEKTGKPYASTATTVDEHGNTVSVMHACAHDVNMTVFVGTARRLTAMADTWQGTLVMIAQPAEERGAGARAMLKDGLFERFPRPDYNLGMHVSASVPAGTVIHTKGYVMASVDSVDITVYGIGGHGAYPQRTKDPVVLSAQIINTLQTLVSRELKPIDAGVVTVGSIHGGTKHNIIPDEVKLQLTVRSYTDEARTKLLEGIKRIARGQAIAMGLPDDKLPDVKIADESTPSTYNNPELTDRIANVLQAKLKDVQIIPGEPVMGGEDFSQYGRVEPKIPSLFLFVGGVYADKYATARQTGEILPSLHSPFFAPDPKPTIQTGVEMMTTSALELLGKVDN